MARIILLALLLTPTAAFGQLVWSDEFDGTSLDLANWEYMIGNGAEYGVPGWGNNELQYYTNRAQNIFVSGGLLHIIARQESYSGFNYTSARIRSLNKRDFRYGRMEARIKLPSTKGIWPAYWMLPTNSPYGGWAASGEIDIMESINIATRIYGTTHFGGPWPNNVNAGGTLSNGTNFANDFHVYAIEWEPDVIRWYVGTTMFYSQTSATWYSTAAPANDRAPFDQFFHFLLNVAVGGNFPGNPDGSSVFPQEMLVDYVRVSDFAVEQAPYGGTARAIPGRVEAEDFDTGPDGVAYHDCDAANNGGQYRTNAGVDIEASSEGGFNVGWMCANEWLEYTVDVATTGLYLVEARVASQATGGSFHLELDGDDRSGSIAVPATGGWQSWITVAAIADLDEGAHVVRFANSAGNGEYNVNHLTFTLLLPVDLDQDGTVDLSDYAILADCVAGPQQSTPPTGCSPAVFSRADLDGDNDVDLADLAEFAGAYGP